jgi:rod shape determining protein RodA
LLVIVLFMPPINGARAWIGIANMGIQPAEFAKISTSLVLARYLSELNIKQISIGNVYMSLAILLIPMTLILLQPDAGTFIVFTSFLFVMYREGLTFDPLLLKVVNLIPGIKYKESWMGKHFIPLLFVVLFISIITLLVSGYNITLWPFNIEVNGFIGVILTLFLFGLIVVLFFIVFGNKREKNRIIVIVLIGFVLSAGLSFSVGKVFVGLAPHQKDRIELFLGLKEDPNGKDYNRNRAMSAVGSGGFSGKGYQNASISSIKTNHVPESETDFIFCPYAEEWGFIGAFVLVGLYLMVILRIVFIAERQRSSFNRVYAYCVAMIFFYHFSINIGMNIGFAPVIGIPLPFFSYGGSSMMSFSIMIFILLKLDSQRKDVLR